MAVDQVDEMEKLPPHVITSMKHLFDKLYEKITPQVEDYQMQESAPTSARASVRGSATPDPTSIRGSATPATIASIRGSARNSATPAPCAGADQVKAAVEHAIDLFDEVVAAPKPTEAMQKSLDVDVPQPGEDEMVEDAEVEQINAHAAPVEEAIIDDAAPVESAPAIPSPIREPSIEATAVEPAPVEVQAEPSPVREPTPVAAAPVHAVTETEHEKMDEDPVENHVEPQVQHLEDDDTDMLL